MVSRDNPQDAAAEFRLRYRDAFSQLPEEEQYIANLQDAQEQEQQLTEIIIEQMKQDGWSVAEDFGDLWLGTSPLTPLGTKIVNAANYLARRPFSDARTALEELAQHGITTRDGIEQASREAERFAELQHERGKRERTRAKDFGPDR